ncbi:MAG: aminotransferase class V-fold PLP-dependent enzyme [Sandaracinus sp.]|nr:aminotransferase class V-fold PLP-dependent enzyme [Sandaracinus sp.]
MLSPDALRPHYSRFLSADRVLLTGHSHQAWPDVAREGVIEAFDDAARHVDDKWGPASEAADAVRAAIVAEIGGAPEDVALAQNTHELVTRFLSALPWRERRHVVTTDGEFHSMRRQLARLEEEGVEITRVSVAEPHTLAERLAAAIRPDTAALLASTVLFETSTVVPHLGRACEAAHAVGAEVLLDAYHHVRALPWSEIDARAFVTGGGYKYAQWGEGVCFLRVPAGSALRPVYTGWFSDFASLASAQSGPTRYGKTGSDRFAGSTYDPTSHYRARAVARFHAAQGMSTEALRALSLHQTTRLLDALDGYEVRTPRAPDARGGFVTVRVPNASEIVTALRSKGVLTDARGENLRFGPAPYVTDDELDRAMRVFQSLVPRQA